MNKKLLLGALLVCGMGTTFTSCVDDTESASVTAVRNAKAEQIKALAGLSDAQAQAALINANATKAAQEALAGLYQAQAAEAEATAAYKNAQTDSEKARAEEAMAEAAYLKQKYANDLQQLAGQLEIDLLNQKKELLEAQTAYDKVIQDNKDEERTKLDNLLSAYMDAQENLFKVQKTLAQDEIELAKLKAGLTTPTDALTYQIASLKQQNTEFEKQNLEYQTYIDTWEHYTKGEAQEAIDQAYKDKLAADEKAKEAQQAKIDAKNANMVALNSLKTSDYMKVVAELCPLSKNDIKTLGSNVMVFYVDENGNGPYNIAEGAPVEARNKYCAYIQKLGMTSSGDEVLIAETYIPMFSDIESKTESIEYQLKYYSDGQTTSTTPDGTAYMAQEDYNVYSAYYNLVPESIDKYITALTENLTYNKEELEKYTKELEQATKDQTIAQTAYDKALAAKATLKTAQDALDAAKKVVADAGDKATEEQKKAAQDAQTAYDKANTELTKALTLADGTITDENSLLANLNEAKNETVNKQREVNEYQKLANDDQTFISFANDNKKALTDGVETNASNMENVNKTELASAEAAVASAQIDNEAAQKNAEWQALSLLAQDSSGQTIKDEIDTKKETIQNNNTQIGNNLSIIGSLQEQLNDANLDTETAISDLEQDIAQNKAQIEVLQAKVDIAKAALDEAMNNGDSAE